MKAYFSRVMEIINQMKRYYELISDQKITKIFNKSLK